MQARWLTPAPQGSSSKNPHGGTQSPALATGSGSAVRCASNSLAARAHHVRVSVRHGWLTLWIRKSSRIVGRNLTFEVGVISAIPYISAAVGMIVIGISSDRTGERFFHIAIPAFLAAIGFTLSAFMVSPIPG